MDLLRTLNLMLLRTLGLMRTLGLLMWDRVGHLRGVVELMLLMLPWNGSLGTWLERRGWIRCLFRRNREG